MPVMPSQPIEPQVARGSCTSSGDRWQPLVVVLVAVCGGIVWDRFWPLPIAWWGIVAVGGVGLWLVAWRRDRLRVAAPFLLLAAAAMAAAWHHGRWHRMATDDLACFAGRKPEPMCVQAIVVAMPRRQATPAFDPLRLMAPEPCSRLEVDLTALRDGTHWRSVSGRAALSVFGAPPEVRAGDRVQCFATLSAPSAPQNPGAFNHRDYLRSEGVHSELRAKSPGCVTVIEPGNWFDPRRTLDQLRTRSNQLFAAHLDPRSAEMAAGVLLGQRDQIESQRIETFMATGTIHLLVIAGLHLSILAGALFWVARRTPLPRSSAVVLAGTITLFYMLLVDAGPPVVRATVLVQVACLAVLLGRRPLGFNSLAAAAMVVLAINPSHLFHVGAQLSFLSVAALIWWAPRWSGRRHSEPGDDSPRPILSVPRRIARSVVRAATHMVLVSLTIWLLTMPLVMARFHLCTPVAVFINAVVWLPMACALLSGSALLAVGGISPALGHLCGSFCNLNLRLLEWCVTAARRIPFGNFWLSGPDDWWLMGFYGGLGVLAAFPRIRRRPTACMLLLIGWIAVGVLPLSWRRHPERLNCTFIAVGHGTAAVLQLPSGKTMLYDAGQFGAPSAGVRAISGFLWSRGIRRLDAVFLSHADVDHYNALPGLMDRFSVGTIYAPPGMFQGDGQAIAALHAIIERHRLPVRCLRGGDRILEGGGCAIEVLHPSGRHRSESTNANSLVLAVEFRGRQILLPGDLESPGMQGLLAQRRRHCEVLMAPHHGSRQSNSPELARWCTPSWVVFSDDGRWNLPEIDATYQAVGSRTLHTNDSGAIEVRINGHGVEVRPFVGRTP